MTEDYDWEKKECSQFGRHDPENYACRSCVKESDILAIKCKSYGQMASDTPKPPIVDSEMDQSFDFTPQKDSVNLGDKRRRGRKNVVGNKTMAIISRFVKTVDSFQRKEIVNEAIEAGVSKNTANVMCSVCLNFSVFLGLLERKGELYLRV